MPPRTATVDESSTRLIKDMYLIVLSLGFTFIVRDLVLTDLGVSEFVAKLLYFLGLYYFLSYDWIAYSFLIDKYPYSMTETLELRYQARFYADLTHLVFKSALIFLGLRTMDFVTLALASGLFALWHVAIVGWHLLARYEYDQYEVTWKIHLVMFSLYLLVGAVTVTVGDDIAPRINSLVVVVVLMTLVVGFSTYRKRDLIAQFGGGSDTGEPDGLPPV